MYSGCFFATENENFTRNLSSERVRGVGEAREGWNRANHRRRRSDGARETATVRSVSGYPRRFRRWGSFWQRGGASRTLEGLAAAKNSGAERQPWLGFQAGTRGGENRGREHARERG
jgi:hypothetical protein